MTETSPDYGYTDSGDAPPPSPPPDLPPLWGMLGGEATVREILGGQVADLAAYSREFDRLLGMLDRACTERDALRVERDALRAELAECDAAWAALRPGD